MTPYLVILGGFAGLLVAMLAVDLLGRAGRGPFTPLSHVVQVAMVRRSGRLLVGAIWLWVGFHFLAR
ncbi:MAG: DUF6186 family protein [Actinomycetota bacterium]|nr:DUF6186 family protein [Actinomycetota bacterium]